MKYKFPKRKQLLFDYRGHWASQLQYPVSDNTCDIVAIEEEKHFHHFKEICNKTDWIFSCYAEIDIILLLANC